MTQNTSLPLVNINDDVDKKVSEFFNGYFLPNNISGCIVIRFKDSC